MYIIAGLGNIGKKYEHHRHNMGFMVLDMYAKKHDLSFKEEKVFLGSIAKSSDMIFVKPETFMNESGLSVKKVLRDQTDVVVVVYDDIDISLGEIKCSFGKSAGGHNGVQSVIDHLGTKEFFRIRVGVRPVHEELQKHILPPHGFEHFLLSNFAPQEDELVEQGITKAVTVLEQLGQKTFEEIMNAHN